VLLKLQVWPPDQRNRGIGTALIQVAEQAARERGYQRIGLGVEIDNHRALRLYERLGYEDWGGGWLCERVTRIDLGGHAVPYDEVFTVLTKRLTD
jgi:RimJ/RimL family protein N-acetyltransferase